MRTNENTSASLPRYAKYVGRIGALAATLGVGAAIATGQGIAVAHAEDGDSDTANTSDVDTSTDTTPAGESDDPIAPQPPTSAEKANNSAPTQNRGPTSTARMRFGNSGGALTSDRWQRRETPRWPREHPTPSVETETTAVQRAETPQNQRHSAQPQQLPRVAATFDNEPAGQPRTRAARLDAPEQIRREERRAVDLHVDRHKIASTAANSGRALNITGFATTPRPTVTSPTATRPALVPRVTTDLLSTVLSPLVRPGPAAPAQPPVLLAVLAWVRREIEHTYFNRVPDVQNQTVTVHPQTPGTFTFAATDDNKLTYSVAARGQASGPTKGTVTVDQATGSFTYTADPTAMDGKPDTFQVTVSDAADGFHVHGLVGFLRPGSGHIDTATVTVIFGNQAPTAPSPTYTVNVGASTNTVDLLTLATDADRDKLTRGRVTITSTSSPVSIDISPGSAIDGTVPGPHADYTLNFTDSVALINVTGRAPGTDTITYTVSDGVTQSTGVITINVVAVNEPPVANSATVKANTGRPTPIDLYELVSDANGDQLTIKTIVVDPDPANPGPIIQVETFDSDDDVVLSIPGVEVRFPDTNRLGEFDLTPTRPGIQTITYTVTDGTVEKTGTVTVNVNATPVANDDFYTVGLGDIINIEAPGIYGNDTDADGDELSLSDIRAVHIPAELEGFTLNPDGSLFLFGGGQAAVATFEYRVTDGKVVSEPGTITIKIGNNPPVADDTTIDTAPGIAVPVDLTSLLHDADNDPLRVTHLNISVPNADDIEIDIGGRAVPTEGIQKSSGGLSIAVPGGGDLKKFTITTTETGRLATYEITYNVTDGNGGTDSGVVTVVKLPPVSGEDGDPGGDDGEDGGVELPDHPGPIRM